MTNDTNNPNATPKKVDLSAFKSEHGHHGQTRPFESPEPNGVHPILKELSYDERIALLLPRKLELIEIAKGMVEQCEANNLDTLQLTDIQLIQMWSPYLSKPGQLDREGRPCTTDKQVAVQGRQEINLYTANLYFEQQEARNYENSDEGIAAAKQQVKSAKAGSYKEYILQCQTRKASIKQLREVWLRACSERTKAMRTYDESVEVARDAYQLAKEEPVPVAPHLRDTL